MIHETTRMFVTSKFLFPSLDLSYLRNFLDLKIWRIHFLITSLIFCEHNSRSCFSWSKCCFFSLFFMSYANSFERLSSWIEEYIQQYLPTFEFDTGSFKSKDSVSEWKTTSFWGSFYINIMKVFFIAMGDNFHPITVKPLSEKLYFFKSTTPRQHQLLLTPKECYYYQFCSIMHVF